MTLKETTLPLSQIRIRTDEPAQMIDSQAVPPWLQRASWLSLGFTVLVILWGAFVRKTHSGAGCGDHWPTCNGQVIPFSPSTETLIEFTHRATSGLALLLTLVVCAASLLKLSRGHPARRAASWSLIFMVIEALVGAGIVIFGLVERNDSGVRAGVIALHLANTYVLVGWMLATALALRDRTFLSPLYFLKRPVLALFAISLILIGSSGAISALGNTLFPPESLIAGMADHANTSAHFLSRLKVIHPVFAVVMGLSLVTWLQASLATRSTALTARSGHTTSILVVANIALGGLDVVLLAPTWLSLTHLLMANLIWISFLWFAHERHRMLVMDSVEASLLPQRASETIPHKL
jgi:cytochrome c oxidase assembly protein subunit 15